jgi:hypothetical protein
MEHLKVKIERVQRDPEVRAALWLIAIGGAFIALGLYLDGRI